MNNLWQDFLTPLQNTLHNIVSFVPRLLVALVLFALFFAVATPFAVSRGGRWNRSSISRGPCAC